MSHDYIQGLKKIYRFILLIRIGTYINPITSFLLIYDDTREILEVS